ncbi:MAG: dialkylresorcinol condensing enzyme, partial [Bacteroidales bacterium]|nr:dialkylresorcinol condensing enzyme [Bacteroidales bacterium]
MTKILILYYSQSGQLSNIVKNFAVPFEKSDNYSVTYANIKPVKEYGFPWKAYEFFDSFPESVNRVPCEIKPLDLGDEDFDLIVFAYTVWYMSPSIPSNSFLLSDQAKRIFKNKPVVTLLGVRNMWVVAQEY